LRGATRRGNLIDYSKEKGVGPSYVTDIHRNDPEICGDIGPIMAFLGSKRSGLNRGTWREQSDIFDTKNADIGAENSYFWNTNPYISV